MKINEKMALHLISEERVKQKRRKGYTEEHDKEHTPMEWIGVIAHELGCLSNTVFAGDRHAYQDALVKIAAVCVAALEAE